MLRTEEGGKSGKGGGLCAEASGVGLEGAAIAECGEECGTLQKRVSEPVRWVLPCGQLEEDVEKPWLDDPDFKQLVEEKGDLYSRKLRGQLTVEGEVRLRKVQREVNGRGGGSSGSILVSG